MLRAMRSLAILALAVGCSHRYPPTSEWCLTYLNGLRTRATADVQAMTLNDASHRHGAEELLTMVGSDPAINVAFEVCADADDDDADRVAARNLRVLDLQTKISNYVLVHGNAALDEPQAKELGRLVEQLAETYTAQSPG
jgi:hypothetical protein